MSNFLERLHLASRERTPKNLVIGLFCLSTGVFAGYYKARLQATLSDDLFTTPHLKEYISEDQINKKISDSSKPAVIYYYQPGTPYHYILRNGFLRCSSRYSDSADFYMVNLKQHLMTAQDELQHEFPYEDYLMEIRFPKELCQIKYSNGELVEKQSFRREFFKHEYRKSHGVEDFLEQNGIKPEYDPLRDFFDLNQRCLFGKMQNQTHK